MEDLRVPRVREGVLRDALDKARKNDREALAQVKAVYGAETQEKRKKSASEAAGALGNGLSPGCRPLGDQSLGALSISASSPKTIRRCLYTTN